MPRRICASGFATPSAATLVDARTETVHWTNNYDRDINDVLAVQDDVAWQVAAKLASTVGVAPPSLKDAPGFAALLDRLQKDHQRWSKSL